MKIIFLDIDGVLQPYNNNERFNHDLKETVKKVAEKYNDEIYFTMDPYDVAAVYYDWDEKAVRLLRDCLDKTGAKIVISIGTHMIETYNKMTEEDEIKILDALSL